ncbi:unnamed protein product [Amoebophrya sp. A25]|nr:unnamed protein product [Amoebophrya sp. A25]|eukprot:GSA25T00013702001.1
MSDPEEAPRPSQALLPTMDSGSGGLDTMDTAEHEEESTYDPLLEATNLPESANHEVQGNLQSAAFEMFQAGIHAEHNLEVPSLKMDSNYLPSTSSTDPPQHAVRTDLDTKQFLAFADGAKNAMRASQQRTRLAGENAIVEGQETVAGAAQKQKANPSRASPVARQIGGSVEDITAREVMDENQEVAANVILERRSRAVDHVGGTGLLLEDEDGVEDVDDYIDDGSPIDDRGQGLSFPAMHLLQMEPSRKWQETISRFIPSIVGGVVCLLLAVILMCSGCGDYHHPAEFSDAYSAARAASRGDEDASTDAGRSCVGGPPCIASTSPDEQTHAVAHEQEQGTSEDSPAAKEQEEGGETAISTESTDESTKQDDDSVKEKADNDHAVGGKDFLTNKDRDGEKANDPQPEKRPADDDSLEKSSSEETPPPTHSPKESADGEQTKHTADEAEEKSATKTEAREERSRTALKTEEGEGSQARMICRPTQENLMHKIPGPEERAPVKNIQLPTYDFRVHVKTVGECQYELDVFHKDRKDRNDHGEERMQALKTKFIEQIKKDATDTNMAHSVERKNNAAGSRQKMSPKDWWEAEWNLINGMMKQKLGNIAFLEHAAESLALGPNGDGIPHTAVFFEVAEGSTELNCELYYKCDYKINCKEMTSDPRCKAGAKVLRAVPERRRP